MGETAKSNQERGNSKKSHQGRSPGLARKKQDNYSNTFKVNHTQPHEGRREKCSPNGGRGIENVFGKTLSLQQTEKYICIYIYVCMYAGMVVHRDDG